MKPAEVKRVLEIVEEGLQLTGVELEEYLARVCGNDSPLRREVLDYLQYDSNLSIFHGTGEKSSPAVLLASNSGSRYELREEIARGGMGVIVRALDTELRREVAVKLLHDSLQGNLGLIRRFVQEAQIGGQLQHPGVAPVYDIGRLPDGRPFMAMKLVKGRTLEALLRSRQDAREDQTRFLGIFEQVCQAVAYAQSHGVIHRDLKPANVMIGEFGEIQVMDWGLAKTITREQRTSVESCGPAETSSDDTASAVTLSTNAGETRVGQVMGTPAYMPPEQAVGRTDKTTDVFALGSILCEILTGLPVGRDLDAAQTRLDNSASDSTLVQLAKTCFAHDPASRPRDAGVLAGSVSEYIEATQVRLEEARLATARAQAVAEEERKRRRITIGMAACCTLAVMIAVASWAWISNQRLTHRLELDAKRARTRSEAEIAYGHTEQLFERAQAASLRDRAHWHAVREAVNRVESLAHTGSLGPEMVERVSNLSNRIATGEAEGNLVLAIDAARQAGIEASRYHLVEVPALEQKALISLLRENRLHPKTGQDWELASRQLHRYSDEVRDEVIGAMDQWLLYAVDEQRVWLARVLQDADRNPWRRVWRAAFTEQNEVELVSMFRGDEIVNQSPRSTLNASYSVRSLIPVEERLLRLRELRARHVNDVWINLRLGRILGSEGLQPEALTYYQAALAAQQTSAVHGVIANAATWRAQYSEAAAHWQEAIRLKPDVSAYHLSLGENLMHAYRYDEAISAFRRAIELSPAGCNYVVNLAGVLSEETVSNLPSEERQGWETAWRTIDALFASNRRAKSNRSVAR
jgi:serine/threonine-protein kinase